MFVLTSGEIEALCVAGGKAPSGGNVQPWLVDIYNKNIFRLSVDPKRSDTFLDVGGYASFLTLGAFYENLVVAADALGLRYQTVFLKQKKPLDPFVEITFLGRKERQKNEALYQAVTDRCTNRKLHSGLPVTDNDILNLQKALRTINPGFGLHGVSKEDERKEVADILGVADGIRTFQDTLFSQMMSELRWNDKEVQETRDGIDIKTMELPHFMANMLKLMQSHPAIRHTIPKKAFETQAKPLLLASSYLCCITTSLKITPGSIFLAGEGMERIWLESTVRKISLHPWTVLPFFIIRNDLFGGEGFTGKDQVVLKRLHAKLRDVLKLNKQEFPIFIFRLHRAKPPTARSLRLDLHQFVTIHS